MQYISKIDQHITNISCYKSEKPKYSLLMVHGMSEHRDRYHNVAQVFSKNNINVYTLDLRGHYESLEDGPLGHFSNFENMAHDIQGIIEMIQEEDNLPMVLFGHSMGSLYVRSYLKRYGDEHIYKLILMGSPYKPIGLRPTKLLLNILRRIKPHKKAQWIANATNKTFIKEIPNPKTQLDWLSFDEENVNNYINDNYCNFPFTYSGYYNLFCLLDDVYNKKWNIKSSDLPILFMIGKKDPCPDFKRDGFNKAQLKLKAAGYHNIQSIIYKNSRHEILNDFDKSAATQDIISFIKN